VGPYSLILQDRTSSTGDLFAAVCDAFSVRQNTPYTFSANVNPGYGGGGGIPTHAAWYFRVLWYTVGATDFTRSSASLISFADIVATSTASGPQTPSGILTSPTNAGFCRIAFYHFYDLVTVPTTAWNLAVSNVRCFAPTDPSDTGQVLPKGSTPYSITNGFTYTATTTSITISWSGLVVYRSDGTTTSITNGSQTITSLSPTTSYYFYPFVNDLAGGTTVSWVAGGVGTPAYAQVNTAITLVQSQNLQSRIALSAGGMVCTTPTSGSSGGSGGGGGGGGCFTGNVRALTANGYVAFNLMPETVLIENETGIHEADLLAHEGNWMLISMGNEEWVTLDHLLKTPDGWEPAETIYHGNEIKQFTGKVYNLHVRSNHEEDKHYQLEHGQTAHNKIF
jgi:hypothetical protein